MGIAILAGQVGNLKAGLSVCSDSFLFAALGPDCIWGHPFWGLVAQAQLGKPTVAPGEHIGPPLPQVWSED